MTDPIADMLTRIRNAIAASHTEVIVPKSKIKVRLAEILKTEGYIEKWEEIKDSPSGSIKITLRYFGGRSVVHELTRKSRPGQRIYIKRDGIRRVKQGLGISIISTPQGLLTGSEARKRKVGGELICEVW